MKRIKSGTLLGMSLFINGLEEGAPGGIELTKVEISACGESCHLAKEVGELVACLNSIRPMNLDAEILRLFPPSFDVPATLAEGRTPQQSVIM